MSAALLGDVQQVRPWPLPDLDGYCLRQEKIVCDGHAIQQCIIVEIKTGDQLNRNVFTFVILAERLDEVDQPRLVLAQGGENWMQITQEASFLQRPFYRGDKPREGLKHDSRVAVVAEIKYLPSDWRFCRKNMVITGLRVVQNEATERFNGWMFAE
jgi:hypothetical protein